MKRKAKEEPEKEIEQKEEIEENNTENTEEEESELEEDVDDSNLNLQNLEFHQFMQLSEKTEKGRPALERIAENQPRPIFVGGTSRETETGSTDSKGEFKYVAGTEENTGPKYFGEPGIENPSERIDLTRARRADSFEEEINQERFFRQSGPRIESQNQGFERAERFDIEKAGRRNSFERPEEKYEKYRQKFPKK